MGEEAGEGDEVVDEKLWGEDEERPNDPNAKTEKDAPVKVDDKSNLEYQAGQPDVDDGPQQEPESQQPEERQQKQEQDTPGGAEEGGDEGGDEGEAGEEGGVNEDAADQYEDRQFAQPQVSRAVHGPDSFLPLLLCKLDF